MYRILYARVTQMSRHEPRRQLEAEAMTRSTDITSFTEHRQNLRAHLRQVRRTGRPLFITTNGETDAVVLSPRAYDALAEKAELAEILALLQNSASDIKRGRSQPAKKALKGIAKRLRLELDR